MPKLADYLLCNICDYLLTKSYDYLEDKLLDLAEANNSDPFEAESYFLGIRSLMMCSDTDALFVFEPKLKLILVSSQLGLLLSSFKSILCD